MININLRRWRLDDLSTLVRYANNAAIANNLTNQFPHPYTREHGESFITMTLEATPTQIFAINFQGEAIGAIGVFPQQDIFFHNAEIGYWLAEPFWGKGIMPKAIALMLDYTFTTWEITRVYARPFGSNIASQRVLEKSGFRLEGRFEGTISKNGRIEDELVYAFRIVR